MGLADEGDVAELERFRQLYPEVAQAVEACEVWWEYYAFSQAIPLSDTMRKRAMAAFEGKPPVVQMRRKSFLPYLVAASLILLAASIGLNFYLYRKVDKVTTDYSFVADPTILKVTLQGVPGKEGNLATVFWDTKTKDVYISSNHLAQAPAGKQYQLWALVDGKPVDAGLLENCNGICHLKNIPKAQAFAITLENAGGSPAPTLSQMYVIGNVKS